MQNKTFNKRMRWLLWRDNIRPAEAARRLGMEHIHFSAMMATSNPKAKTLRRLAETFGVSVQWLLGEGAIEDGYRKTDAN